MVAAAQKRRLRAQRSNPGKATQTAGAQGMKAFFELQSSLRNSGLPHVMKPLPWGVAIHSPKLAFQKVH